MHAIERLRTAVEHEISMLDVVLGRATSVRLLMAAGLHDLVGGELAELDGAIAAAASAGNESLDAGYAAGFASDEELSNDLGRQLDATLAGLLARRSMRRRDVASVLTTMATTAERAMHVAASHVGDLAMWDTPTTGPRHRYALGV